MSDEDLKRWVGEVGEKHGFLQSAQVLNFEEGEKVVITKEDMAVFDTYVKEAYKMVRTMLNSIAIVSLAESTAVTTAISQITNQAQFASEFEATANYKKALADAFIGGWKGVTEKGTKAAMSAMGLPDVATPIFKFLDTIEKENKRALANAKDKTVKDFLNKSLNDVVSKMSNSVKQLGKDSELSKACEEAVQMEALNLYEDDKASGNKQRDGKLTEFIRKLETAISKSLEIGTIDVESKHKQALNELLTGLTKNGYIDFGVVGVTAEPIKTASGLVFKQKSGPEFENNGIPKLKGTAKDDRFANAISDYLKKVGGTVNDLDIEKRAHFILYLRGSGVFSFLTGHNLDGYASWNKGLPKGVKIDGGDMLSLMKGDIPEAYLTATHKAFEMSVRKKLTATKVAGG